MPVTKVVKKKNPVEKPGTRAASRAESDSLSLSEERQDVKDSQEGRKFLEKHLLLWPEGEPATHASLSTCLHQVSAMAGVHKTAVNAIRAVAFMLDEMEDTQIHLSVKEAFDSQITEFTSDMKTLIVDAKTKLDTHFKATEDRLAQVINNSVTQARQAPTAGTTYASMLSTPPPHANPRIAAREGIKARQFLMEGLSETKFSHTDVFQLKGELNKIIGTLGVENIKIRSINKLRNGNALVEMESDEATAWFADKENRTNFGNKIGPSIKFCSRVHNLIVFNVPLALDPDDPKHRQEICEANNLDQDTIPAARWAKPINRRSPEQRTAHLIVTYANADAANRAITNGLYVCNRRCYAERVKREPTRCLRCQGWNHFAKECKEEHSTCGNCTRGHRTSECPTPEERICASCEVDGHASWSRECPTFIKKLNELNNRNPENALQYIPTADPWTWTTNADSTAQPHRQAQQPPARPPPKNEQHPRPPARKNSYQPQARQYDSYVPNYDKTGRRTPWQDHRDGNPPKDLATYRPIDKQYMDAVNNDNPNRPPAPTAAAPTT
jgi:hypothetical protein